MDLDGKFGPSGGFLSDFLPAGACEAAWPGDTGPL